MGHSDRASEIIQTQTDRPIRGVTNFFVTMIHPTWVGVMFGEPWIKEYEKGVGSAEYVYAVDVW